MNDDPSRGPSGKPLSLMRAMFDEAVKAALHDGPQARSSMLAFVGSAAAQAIARKEINSAVAAFRAERKTVVCEFDQPQSPTAGSFTKALSASMTALLPSTGDAAMTSELVRKQVGGRTLFVIVNGCRDLFGNAQGQNGILSFLQDVASIRNATVVMFGDASLLGIREHPQLDRRLRFLRLDEVADRSSV